MHLDSAYSLFESLRDDEQFFTYQGDFSDQITNMIINLVEENIPHKDTGLALKLRSKVSFLMVESFQNIIRHSEADAREELRHAESFQVRSRGGVYYITSANLVNDDRIEGLRSKLDQLNNMARPELKALYMDALYNNSLSEKGGAGLGLIEMARKSGRKLQYAFLPARPGQSYFYFQTSLGTNEQAESQEVMSPIEESIRIHQVLKDKGVFVLNKGNFSHEAIKPMLNMVEKNLVSHLELLAEQKILFHLLVELLQNISNHSLASRSGENEGIFYMGQDKKGYFITAGNYISKDKIENLTQSIDQINSMSKSELQALYKSKLRGGPKEKARGAGIGLIDLARFSKSYLDYRLFEVDANRSFFSITVVD